MRIVIDIPEDIYEWVVLHKYVADEDSIDLGEAIIKGIALPKRRGRLIDADALIEALADEHIGGLDAIKKAKSNDDWTDGLHTAWQVIEDAPTIIEADKED